MAKEESGGKFPPLGSIRVGESKRENEKGKKKKKENEKKIEKENKQKKEVRVDKEEKKRRKERKEGERKRREKQTEEKQKGVPLLYKIYENRTIGFRQSKRLSRSMHRELRMGIKILEFRQTPRGREFFYLDYF